MLTSTVGSNTCTVGLVIPAAGSSYVATRVEVEITGVVGGVGVTTVHTTGVVVVQATATVAGSITISGVPLYDTSGNSIKVKYFSADLVTYEVLNTTGIYVRSYA